MLAAKPGEEADSQDKAKAIAAQAARVQAAMLNIALEDEVDEGRFRDDLYYRLNVLHLHLPPLRERADDIPMLTDHFINKFAKMLNKPNLRISGEALRYLAGLPWEGNVRELENTIERAAILCSNDVIQTEDVHPDVTGSKREVNWAPDVDFEKFIPSNLPLPEVLSGVEEQMVKRALENANFVQARAAESLGITKSLLQYKMKKYHLQKK